MLEHSAGQRTHHDGRLMVLSSPVSMETDGESFIFQNRPSDKNQTVSAFMNYYFL